MDMLCCVFVHKQHYVLNTQYEQSVLVYLLFIRWGVCTHD